MKQIETIYIAPGNSQCRIYAMPYPMRPGQKPSDIAHQYQKDWRQIGLLNYQLKLAYLEKEYRPFGDDIEGQCGGTFFEIEREIEPEDGNPTKLTQKSSLQ